METIIAAAISAAVTNKAHKEVGIIAESGLRISAVIALPMGVGLAVMSYPIVNVLFKDTHAIGPTILSYLGLASVFVCIALVTTSILQATGHEKLTIISMLAGGAVKIAANLLLVGIPSVNILGAAIGTICCYLVICILNGIFIFRTMTVKPNYGRVFLRPLLSAAVMGAGAWAVYGILSGLLHVSAESSRMLLLVAMAGAIAVAALIYLLMIIVTRAITLEDMKLIPKGEKLGKLLHIR